MLQSGGERLSGPAEYDAIFVGLTSTLTRSEGLFFSDMRERRDPISPSDGCPELEELVASAATLFIAEAMLVTTMTVARCSSSPPEAERWRSGALLEADPRAFLFGFAPSYGITRCRVFHGLDTVAAFITAN